MASSGGEEAQMGMFFPSQLMNYGVRGIMPEAFGSSMKSSMGYGASQ